MQNARASNEGPLDNLFLAAVTIAILAAVAVAAFSRIREYRRQQQALSWPIAEGEITSTDFAAYQNSVRLDVYYEFKIGEEIYTGSETFSDRTPATKLNLPNGAKVRVRYRADDPQEHNALRWRDQAGAEES